MASSYGRAAWEKYFSCSDVVTKLKKQVAVNDVVYNEGCEITVKHQEEYSSKVLVKFPCQTEHLVSFNKIKKPIEKTLMAIPFTPSALGLAGSTKIGDYIDLLRYNISKKIKDELGDIMLSIVDIVDWNASNTTKKKAIQLIQDEDHIRVATQHKADIQKHFLEAIGPIWVCNSKIAGTSKSNSIITFSNLPNFKEYDFHIKTGSKETRFTAKGLTGTTNTLKVDNIVRRIYEEPKLKSKWEDNNSFELLKVISGYDSKTQKLEPVKFLSLNGVEYLSDTWNVKIPAESVRMKYRQNPGSTSVWHSNAAKYNKIVMNFVNSRPTILNEMNEMISDYFGGDMLVIKGGFAPKNQTNIVNFNVDSVPVATMRSKGGEERIGFLL